MESKSSRWKPVVIALSVVAVAAVGYFVWSAYDHQAVMAWLEGMRPLPFFVAMTILPALGVPTTWLYILAGASFGIPVGLVLSLLALAVNAALCFWLARKARPLFSRVLSKLETDLPDFTDKRKGALRLVLGVKLAPGVPMFIKNYGLGISGVPFRMFFLATMLLTGIYAAAFVVVGSSLLEHQPNRTLIAIVVLAALVAAVMWYRRRQYVRRSSTYLSTVSGCL
jgi:uncharacterized membrane protein YdjX (TVP38/TMEM64 family)